MLLTAAGGACAKRRFADRITNPEWPLFTQSVVAYNELVGRLEREVPPLPEKATAEQIAAHKKAMSGAARKARSAAKQGDIFTPAVRAQFVRVIRTEVRGQEGKAAKRTIQEDNPAKPAKPGENSPAPVKLAVNALYPDSAPLSTVPPTLLLRLPELPKGLEYRFVGQSFVLFDERTNLIVDFIPNR